MNQFSFNLDQNYLQHDKFGAHYSKNWDKKKHDEYNAWYYKTHKDKWKRINEQKLEIARDNKNYIRFYNDEAAEARKKGLAGDKGIYPGYSSHQKKLARRYKQEAKGIITGNRVYNADPSTLTGDEKRVRESYKNRFGAYLYDDINSAVHILSRDKTIYVYPFWGDADRNKIGITRNDINLDYKFEPSCIFMGSSITDSQGNYIGTYGMPNGNCGRFAALTTSSGNIEIVLLNEKGDDFSSIENSGKEFLEISFF